MFAKMMTTKLFCKKNSTALFDANKFVAALLLMVVLLCGTLPENGHAAALFPLAEPTLIGNTNGGLPMLIRWQDFLNMQKQQKQRHLPVYGGGDGGDDEFMQLAADDKLFTRPSMQQRFLVPPKLPMASSKILAKRRGDEKRRDFEHGWEQCEFSPISCMLKRRRRR